MGELARPHAQARAYDLCTGAESGYLRDHAARTGKFTGAGLCRYWPFSMTVQGMGAFATDVDSGRLTTGNQAHGVSLQLPEGTSLLHA